MPKPKCIEQSLVHRAIQSYGYSVPLSSANVYFSFRRYRAGSPDAGRLRVTLLDECTSGSANADQIRPA